MTAPVLLADMTTIKILIVILIVVISLIARLVAKIRSIGEIQAMRRPPRANGGSLQNQIEEFLRRAAQRQGAQSPPQPEQPKPLAQPEQAGPLEAPVRAEVVEEEPVGGRVTRHVQRDLDTSEFVRRSSELGEQVSQADEHLEEHLRQKFAGEVGRLAGRPGETAAPPVAVAEPLKPETPAEAGTAVPVTGLAGLFRSPESIVQAIVVSEILGQPRWKDR